MAGRRSASARKKSHPFKCVMEQSSKSCLLHERDYIAKSVGPDESPWRREATVSTFKAVTVWDVAQQMSPHVPRLFQSGALNCHTDFRSDLLWPLECASRYLQACPSSRDPPHTNMSWVVAAMLAWSPEHTHLNPTHSLEPNPAIRERKAEPPAEPGAAQLNHR